MQTAPEIPRPFARTDKSAPCQGRDASIGATPSTNQVTLRRGRTLSTTLHLSLRDNSEERMDLEGFETSTATMTGCYAANYTRPTNPSLLQLRQGLAPVASSYSIRVSFWNGTPPPARLASRAKITAARRPRRNSRRRCLKYSKKRWRSPRRSAASASTASSKASTTGQPKKASRRVDPRKSSAASKRFNPAKSK